MTFMVNVIIFLLLAVLATSIHICLAIPIFSRGETIEVSLENTYRKAGPAIILVGVTTALGLIIIHCTHPLYVILRSLRPWSDPSLCLSLTL